MTRKLMCVFAHPDDESLGMGGTLAKYAAEGIEIALVTATRGERGWGGRPEAYPGAEALGRVREQELRCAAETLGIGDLTFLGIMDGEVDQAEPGEIISRIAKEICRFQPQVVVTFGPDGAYGHPDHIAISQFTSAAVTAAAAGGAPGLLPAHAVLTHAVPSVHQVQKLYYMVDSLELVELVKQVMGGIAFQVDGKMRYHVGWEEWMITTRIDATAYWEAAWRAIQCHTSQLVGMAALHQLTSDQHRQAWGTGNFYRVFSLVNGGRKVEEDLFEGL
jgi:LmbE family N-acetylglucosaminyl deacetylase